MFDMNIGIIDAEALLIEGANDPNGRILAIQVMAGILISANGRMFVNAGEGPRVEARWKGALEELEKCGFVKAASYKREVFEVTREGYAYTDRLSGARSAMITPKANCGMLVPKDDERGAGKRWNIRNAPRNRWQVCRGRNIPCLCTEP